MICYVFKVRESKYRSKRDEKMKNGWNLGLVSLEGAKFHLETFIDKSDSVFANIDEFEVYTPQGSQYVKKIISVMGHKSLEDAKKFLE